jgi:hypothetical protein
LWCNIGISSIWTQLNGHKTLINDQHHKRYSFLALQDNFTSKNLILNDETYTSLATSTVKQRLPRRFIPPPRILTTVTRRGEYTMTRFLGQRKPERIFFPHSASGFYLHNSGGDYGGECQRAVAVGGYPGGPLLGTQRLRIRSMAMG